MEGEKPVEGTVWNRTAKEKTAGCFQAYWNSLRPTPTKVCENSELWLEWAGMSWSEVELSTI